MSDDSFMARIRANIQRYQEIKHLADRVKSEAVGYARRPFSTVTAGPNPELFVVNAHPDQRK